jgi:glycerol-3-phosphate O-acyltransferase
MGAYFIRRRSRNTLYRRVLARYVQMATAEGATQAIFPEGGLSLDGRVGEAKMGLLSYMVAGWEPTGRDVVFVPVGLGYDRVLEDRILLQAAAEGNRQFRSRPIASSLFALKVLWKMLRGVFPGFGTAAAGFGAPISLAAFTAAHPGAPVEALAARLMAEIARVVPVTPVPLTAAALAGRPADRAGLLTAMERIAGELQAVGAVLRLPPQGMAAALEEGLTPLIRRGLVGEDLSPAPQAVALLDFYAAPVRQRLEAGDNAATQQT